MKYRRICCKCKWVIDPGDEGAPETHGLCPSCLQITLDEIDALDAQDEQDLPTQTSGREDPNE
jgi:hypothetical protein